MAKNTGLGRGLSAILDDVEDAYRQSVGDEESSVLVKDIALEDIVPNPYQPRKYFDEEALKDLSDSILKHGLLQPIVVIKKDHNYIIIAGERRFRASKLANLPTIKAIVADIESQNMRELALIENIQRENLNPLELANSYKELIEEHNITQEELSDMIKKSRSQISNTIRLLNLSEYTQDLLKNSKISQGHARVLVGLEEDKQKIIADTIIGQKLSVRDCEELVRNINKPQDHTEERLKSEPNYENIALKDLTKKLKDIGFNAKKSGDRLIINMKKDTDIENFLSFFE
jgi:ParB family chromosome partitioning protein